MDGAAAQDSRLRAVFRLADAHAAHVAGGADTGIGWLDYALLTGAVALTTAGPDVEILRGAARARLDMFEDAARRAGVAAFEARMVEDETRDALPPPSRYADLVVERMPRPAPA